jgi:glycosyltransferase involved in cell wall biosynthesis
VEQGANGYLVKIKDENDLLLAFNAFINLSYQEKELMGSIGRAKAMREFDDKKISEDIFTIIMSLSK